MSDPISRDDAIKAFEEEKQKAKEIRDDFAKFPNSVFEQSIYNEAVKSWRTAINIVKNLPTIDAVPRQKYEEDMENAFAHGYTDSESNFRKMIADGELVEVVRCKDCKYKNVYRFPPQYRERDYCVKHEKTVDVADFCSWAERRAE